MQYVFVEHNQRLELHLHYACRTSSDCILSCSEYTNRTHTTHYIYALCTQFYRRLTVHNYSA